MWVARRTFCRVGFRFWSVASRPVVRRPVFFSQLFVFALIYNYSNQLTPLEIKDGRTEVGPVAEAEEEAAGEGPISGVYETWAAHVLKWVEDEAGSGASL
jgi:hypothetical protein